MSVELVIRVLLGVACWATGAALLVPVVAERRGPAAAAIVLVVGSVTVAVLVAVPYWSRRRR